MVPSLQTKLTRLLATLIDSRGIQSETLAIQREILVHVRSLDAKFGGTIPTVATP